MSPCAGAFRTFYRWLVFFGICLFGIVVAAHQGFISALLLSDASYLSAVILLLLLVTSLDAGRRAYRLGSELCAALQISQRARTERPLFDTQSDDGVTFAEIDNQHSYAHEHLLLLANKTRSHGALCDQNLLLERLENALGRGHETGWFLADLMVRLGLLGTVIGFIFMLSSIANVSSVDIHAMQQLLTNMGDGMRIALYTTLSGLGAGIVLGFQYRLLDVGVDRLMAEIIELSEVHATRHLRRLVEA